MPVDLSEKAVIARKHREGKRRNFSGYVQELGIYFIRDWCLAAAPSIVRMGGMEYLVSEWIGGEVRFLAGVFSAPEHVRLLSKF